MIDAPTLTTMLLAALATARITTLIVHDSILERARHELFLASPPPDDIDRGYAYQSYDRVPWRRRRESRGAARVRRGLPPRRAGFAGSLVACTHCTGVWVAVGVLAALRFAPGAVTTAVVVVAAVAQVAEIAVRGARA